MQQVQCCFDLGGKTIPQLEGKVAVGGSKGTYKMRFESLNCSLCSIDPVIIGLDKHVFALLFCKNFFDDVARLVIHGIQSKFMSLQFKELKLLTVRR